MDRFDPSDFLSLLQEIFLESKIRNLGKKTRRSETPETEMTREWYNTVEMYRDTRIDLPWNFLDYAVLEVIFSRNLLLEV